MSSIAFAFIRRLLEIVIHCQMMIVISDTDACHDSVISSLDLRLILVVY